MPSVIASKSRLGRVMHQCRRALIAAAGRPLLTRELLAWVYPRVEHYECWHYWSIYRAAPRYAIKDGRTWIPRPELMALIRPSTAHETDGNGG
jgi:hypothetical protein